MRRAFCLAALLCLAGCGGKLKFDATADDIPAFGTKAWEIDGPSGQQRVTVAVKPSKGSLTAYLVKDTDKEAAYKELDKAKPALASEILLGSGGNDSSDEFSFEATVPAKTAYVLILRAGKKQAGATVSIVGK